MRLTSFPNMTSDFSISTQSFWREQGSCADTLNMQGTLEAVQEKTEHPILVVFDHTSANGNPALMGAFGALSLREKTVRRIIVHVQ